MDEKLIILININRYPLSYKMLLVQAKNDDEQFLLIKISGGEYKKWLNNIGPPPQ
jgi:hypothetical protein